jgi:ferredoxin-NADP reductase
MSALETVLLRRDVVARDTVALTFAKPAGFTFKPGQSIDLTLLDAPRSDAKGAGRALSIVSAPFEDGLTIASRVRDSAFKQWLRDMPLGTRVQFDGPFGSMTLHANRSRPAVFIAGGIGITPFMSMLRQAAHDALPQVIKLLYSNRLPADAAFLAELQQLEQRQRGSFRLIATMTGALDAGASWSGPRGLISAELVRSVVAQPVPHVYYVAGPPAMVAGMRKLLADMGVSDDDIRSEDFAGY